MSMSFYKCGVVNLGSPSNLEIFLHGFYIYLAAVFKLYIRDASYSSDNIPNLIMYVNSP